MTEPALQAERIMVYGVCGSGKSTLAARLSTIIGVPWHSIDDLTWEPGWVPVSDDIQRARVAEICAGPRWIIDHGYGRWLDLPLARVDIIIGLDYSRMRSLARLVRRSIRRVILRTPTCNGNVETLRSLLAKDSVLTWHFQSFSRKRDRMRSWAADQDPPTLIFSRPRDLERWLAELSSATTDQGAIRAKSGD